MTKVITVDGIELYKTSKENIVNYTLNIFHVVEVIASVENIIVVDRCEFPQGINYITKNL